MTAEIKIDTAKLKKNDIATYSISVTPENKIQNAHLEIIPTAEKFPEMDILPDISSVTVSNGLTYSSDITENGIFVIDIPQIHSTDTFTISYSAQVVNNFNKNTTAVIVTSDNNGSTYEAYAQTTVDGYSLPIVIPVACVSIFVVISVFMLRFALKRII